MDTKLKADIAESAVVTELLKRGYRVLRPVGDRLPYDIAVDIEGRILRIQVKSAWYDEKKRLYSVDVRRTKTNRRRMIRNRYGSDDFDIAILYVEDLQVFYVLPVDIFNDFGSTISLVEEEKRQRLPRSAEYRDRWELLAAWATRSETIGDENPSNSANPSPDEQTAHPVGDAEPSPEK